MVVSPRGVGVATVAVAVAGIASPAAATVPPTAAPVLSAAWVNRISSTWNQCPNVYFWDGFDKTGAYLQTDLTTNNLGAFSDRANSIGYA